VNAHAAYTVENVTAMVPNHPAVATWLEQRIGIRFIEPFTTMGFVKRGRLVAGILFHNWSICDVEIGVAAEPGGFVRADLSDIADYVFHREDRRRISAITPHSNKSAKQALLRLGFEFEGVKKDYFPKENGVSYVLRRDRCKWLTPRVSLT
jgi:RimJ/RimL family protein N-acetyltransferase